MHEVRQHKFWTRDETNSPVSVQSFGIECVDGHLYRRH